MRIITLSLVFALSGCFITNPDHDDNGADSCTNDPTDSDSDADTGVDDTGSDDSAVDSDTGSDDSGGDSSVDSGSDTGGEDSGNLTVTLDESSASSTIILGGSTAVAMSKFKFEASDEAFVVKRVDLENTGSADDAASVVKISYTNSAGATETKSEYLSAGIMSFDGLDFYVPTESTSTVTVTIDTASVSSTGVASGSTIQLDLIATDFEAVGALSGETITTISAVSANAMTLRKTKPTLSLSSGSPSGVGVAGDSEVFRFNVAADSRGEVSLNQVTFKVVTSESGSAFNACDTFADPAKFTLYDMDDSSEILDEDVDWAFVDDTDASCEDGGGDMDVVSYAILSLSASELVGAGETKTYVLKVDTLGASAGDDDAIRVEIPDQDEADGVKGGTDAINWGDDEDLGIDGDLVKSLPVTGGTIQY